MHLTKPCDYRRKDETIVGQTLMLNVGVMGGSLANAFAWFFGGPGEAKSGPVAELRVDRKRPASTFDRLFDNRQA